MDTPANQIPQFGYDIGKVPDIGSGYAAGITAAGQGIAKGVEAGLDVLNRNRRADDMLTAMNKQGILSDDAYKSVAGKSLGAKEGMLGMYASEWINQQAQERELQKLGYQGNIQMAIERQKLLDTYNLYKVREPGKFPLASGGGGSNTLSTRTTIPPPPLPAGTASLAGTTANPTPLAQVDITNPRSQQPAQLKIGEPVGGDKPHPANWTLKSVRGQPGYMEADGLTFHPLQAQSFNLPSQFGGAGGA